MVNIFEEDFDTGDVTSWMSDEEFLCKYRVTCEQPDAITVVIAEDSIFKKPKRGFPQMPVTHQLMIWLHFVGHKGQSDSKQHDNFKISRGMCRNSCKRIVKAMNNIGKEYIWWTSADERTEISKWIEREFHITNCPLMMGDALLHLGIEPECDDAADYHARKFTYSITVNVINDNKR